jgi:putative endonuclease
VYRLRGLAGRAHASDSLPSAVPHVYLLRCRDGTLYAGAAVALEKRLAEHVAGKASRYTRSRLPVALVWSVEVESWSAALKEEHRIKSLARSEKEALIAAAAPKRARGGASRPNRSGRANTGPDA